MKAIADLLRDRQTRLFFLAHGQSSLGTGAGYVALLLLAYERLESPWAIALVLLADLLPGMTLGPVFGAAADRWSRRRCAVASDLIRAVAFIGLSVVDGFAATVALALLAGAGTGLFTPAVMAALPGLVGRERLPAATSLYGAQADFGHTLGPALAALALLVASPETVMLANGITFALSALLVARLDFGDREPNQSAAGGRLALLREARSGLAATARMPGVRVVIASSSAVVLFAGLFNVGELLLVTEELDAGASGFSALVAVFGAGVVAGSLLGSRGGSLAELKHRYLLGVLVVGLGFIAAALAPSLAVAVPAFALGGLGNGLVLVHERLLLQSTVPDSLAGRVFGVKDTFTAWGFAIALVSAGLLVSVLGTRPMLLAAGAGALLVWVGSARALRGEWTGEEVADHPPPVAKRASIHETAEVVSSGAGNR